MNLLILEESQLTSSDCAIVNERQKIHINNVLKLQNGQSINVGLLNGNKGKAVVERNNTELILRKLNFQDRPPPALPLTLILALPRPQMLKRILQTVATMGVTKLIFIQTSKVEKSFWQSPTASDDSIRQHLILGLEQGGATQLPTVHKYKRFKPFIEDELTNISKHTKKLIAHPGAKQAVRELSPDDSVTLAIGPEGGFIEKEIQMFEHRGFNTINLGKRILKVETAVPVIIAKLFSY